MFIYDDFHSIWTVGILRVKDAFHPVLASMPVLFLDTRCTHSNRYKGYPWFDMVTCLSVQFGGCYK